MSEIYIDFTTHVGLRLSSLFDWSHSQTSGIHEFQSTGESTRVYWKEGMLKNVMLTLIENMQLGSVSNKSGLYDPEQN